MNELLNEILEARELRVKRQRELLAEYQKPLVCFTMNIPGPKKYDRDVAIGFFIGNRMLTDALRDRPVLHTEQHTGITGCEALYVVDMPARELKELTVSIEDSSSVCRLFDMDVLDTDGKKLERQTLGYPRRTCLLCDQDAVICARSRAHSLEQLQERTGFLLYLTARQQLTEFVAVQAWLALQQEVLTTPKPGLVDRDNRGAHTDMGLQHFFVSGNALRPYFAKFTDTGFLTRDDAPEETFQKIRPIGLEAEQTMFAATHGVNTHKGAIFSLGLLCAAAGRLNPLEWSADTLLAECAAMTRGLVANDLGHITRENAATAGEKLYAEHGVTGVRGQAEAGFPAVAKTGLPVLKAGLKQGLSLNDAGCAALLHLLSSTDDTNLIHRSDRQTQLQLRQEIAALLEKDPYPTPDTIRALDQDFIRRNLSPGGSADLLAMCYFLLFLE